MQNKPDGNISRHIDQNAPSARTPARAGIAVQSKQAGSTPACFIRGHPRRRLFLVGLFHLFVILLVHLFMDLFHAGSHFFLGDLAVLVRIDLVEMRE